ncbi:type I restriction-modification system subunit M [Halodesulfovibrio sp.]|jgi:type I restriction enzyme M protein|uniref:type I restriction-modification system subunit M n=1 Tax=Halodesulfovibrio sp. TaxID=1912772 RepID=UPI0025D2829F|nr:type I restriction-modification system subunit M [Halodesulfovibrio sp.]MCT4627234.1 type I restriction-modification system subunit M [Halodesulfovibrio sp.]
MSPEQRKLHQKLWDIADELRGSMNPDEFKNYILGFIFFKFLSEKIDYTLNEVLKDDGMTFTEVWKSGDEELQEALKDESIKILGYFLEPEYLFHHFVEQIDKGEFILDDLSKALKKVEDSTQGEDSEDDFMGLFDDVDLTSVKLGKTVEAKNKKIGKIFAKLAELDFRIEDSEADILGDAYEYLIGQFASGAGKKAGEFYTPQEVSSILARIVTQNKTRISSAYDPTCGSGSLLLRIAREGHVDVGHFYGQENNSTTHSLARMNMLLHDVKFDQFDIQQGDTLEDPLHGSKKFEAVVANPPFSAKWSASNLFLSDERFAQYGKLAPKTKADFAFVQHMLYHLDDKGTMAVVLPHGVLFRGAAEGVIRKYLITEKNWLDAVIGLPANIFFGTSIPTCILVFKKCREQSDNIMFIDASNDFEKVKTQNKLLPEHIEKIIETYTERKDVDKYAYIASMEEIAENDYNLNIPRYVDTFEEEEPVDLAAVVAELNTLQAATANLDSSILKNCQELGIPAPVFMCKGE